MMHVKFSSKSIMAKVEKMVDNLSTIDVDAAVTEALNDVTEYLLKEMQTAVKRHYRKGNAYRAVKRTDVQRAGNYQWVYVGAMDIRAEDKDGFHVIYLEYGSPTLPADPWLRPAFEKRAQIQKIVLDTFRKYGVQNVKAA